MTTKIISVIVQILIDFFMFLFIGMFGGMIKIIFDLNQNEKFGFKKIIFTIFLSGIIAVLFGFVYIMNYGDINYESKQQIEKIILITIVIGIFGNLIIKEAIFTINILIKDIFSKSSKYLLQILEYIGKIKK